MANPRQPNTLGLRDRIRQLMGARSWSAADLARHASTARATGHRIPTSTITRWLSGETQSVSHEVYSAVQKALSADLADSALQVELDLTITDDFLERARDAIEEHLRKVKQDLHSSVLDVRLVGVVGLRVEQLPTTRVYERLFDIPLRWTDTSQSKSAAVA